MNNEDLLKALGELAQSERDDDPYDARWDALTAGTLDEGESSTLRALATSSDSGVHPQACDFFQPLDDEARGRMADRLLESRSKIVALPVAPRAEPSGSVEEPAGGRRVIPFTIPRRRWFLAAIAAIAAAGLTLLLVPSTPSTPMPGYQLSINGERTERRGDPASAVRSIDASTEIARFRPDARFELLLRPSEPPAGPVAIRGVVLNDQEVRSWNPPTEISPTGSVRIAGPVKGILPIPPGQWTLAIAVGHPDTLPTRPEAWWTRSAHAPDAAWRLVRARIDLRK